jgi:hypothetical protein
VLTLRDYVESFFFGIIAAFCCALGSVFICGTLAYVAMLAMRALAN